MVEARGGKRRAQAVLDIIAVEPEELLKVIAMRAEIAQEDVLFV